MENIPGKGDLANAMRLAPNRWETFALFVDDGRVAVDNDGAERAIKIFVFAGSDAGGEVLAEMSIRAKDEGATHFKGRAQVFAFELLQCGAATLPSDGFGPVALCRITNARGPRAALWRCSKVDAKLSIAAIRA